MIIDPKGDGAMVHFQMAGNPPKIASVHVHLLGSLTYAFRVAVVFGLWSVLPLAVHTTVALRS